MKRGDKIKVTYAKGDQFIGRITGETEKTWKVDFDGGKVKRISKEMKIELIDDPKTPEKEVVSRPANVDKMLKDYKRKEARKINRRMAIIIGITLLLAATAILIGLDKLHMGAEGIFFNF